MGYFTPPVRRGVARAERLAWLDASRELEPNGWTAIGRSFVAPRDAFLRFCVERPGGGTIGVFRASAFIKTGDALPASVQSRLRATYRWFNLNLRYPRRMPRTAVCWFRADAEAALERVRVLVEIFKLAGRPVQMRSTTTPGRIVYQDALQVAAVPYADRRVTASIV